MQPRKTDRLRVRPTVLPATKRGLPEEQRRRDILEQLNNLGRLLEQRSPDMAKEFNIWLSKLVEKLADVGALAESLRRIGLRPKGSGR